MLWMPYVEGDRSSLHSYRPYLFYLFSIGQRTVHLGAIVSRVSGFLVRV